jgi:hypothetical protein
MSGRVIEKDYRFTTKISERTTRITFSIQIQGIMTRGEVKPNKFKPTLMSAEPNVRPSLGNLSLRLRLIE